jgi:hypothetical protein
VFTAQNYQTGPNRQHQIMSTITGTITDATGAPLHARIDFLSKSTPLAGGGIVTTNTDKTVRTDPTAGTFSVVLVGGNYQVIITAQGQSSTFNIVVPSDNLTYTIDQVTSTPLAFVYTPPNTVWNGTRAGHITFLPIAAPVAAPTLVTGNYGSGSMGLTDQSSYCFSWQNANGDTTLASPAVADTPPNPPTTTGINILLPNPPAGVTAVTVYRSTDAGATWGVLQSGISPLVTSIIDKVSNAIFAAGANPTAHTLPQLNTTAGGLLSSSGNYAAYVTDSAIFFPGTNLRIKANKGPQLYNFTTGLWHTLLATGNPAQLGLDAGSP